VPSQGRRFFLHELEAALRSVEAVAKPSLEYQLVKPKDDGAPLKVRVEMGSGDPDPAVGTACTAAIDQQLGLKADVEVLARETLPRSGYKATRMVDD
jgi:phenylacetate-coenzyme A ligase PaaK-like adenylate-forming protein